MDSNQPPVLVPPGRTRRNAVTFKLVLIAALVLVLQIPLGLINELRQERARNRGVSEQRVEAKAAEPAGGAAEGYRMVERGLKHSVLVLALTFTAFFLFEMLAGLRLHAVHYGLVGAALALFYLALLALGEVLEPGWAYAGAATASSLLIVCYSVSILRSHARATTIAALLASEHSVLFVVLRMENYALLAGTAALFVALGALMFFTRNVDWSAEEGEKGLRT